MAEINRAIASATSNPAQGYAQVEQTLNDAREEGVPKNVRMAMHRTFATFLYQKKEIDRGDQQVENVITLAKGSETEPVIADQLTHVLQDRGWTHYNIYERKLSKDPGNNDLERAVEIAEKAFGPNHHQTIYKIATLAVICAGVGETSKANQLIDRAIKAATTTPEAKECQWYAYMMQSRVKGIERQYQAAADAFLKARKLAASKDQRERMWYEFKSGLEFGQPSTNPISERALKLLDRSNYAELDRLAESYAKTRAKTSDGRWMLDLLNEGLSGFWELPRSKFEQRVFDLERWLQRNPDSFIAKTALAQTYLYSMSNSATFNRSPNAKAERLKEIRKLLTDDRNLGEKTPIAYSVKLRLLVQEENEPDFLKVNAECHKKYPDYAYIDRWAIHFLRPQWYGSDAEVRKFIETRSNTIGGAQGDKLYAQLVWYIHWCYSMDELFGTDVPLNWERVKKGFKQIFAEYPNDMDARIEFIKLALEAKDNDAIKSAFNGFTLKSDKSR